MIFSETTDQMHKSFSVILENISNTDIITVRQDVSIVDWTWDNATVNWSAMGSVSPAQAIDFAEALKVAAAKANEWDKDAGTKQKGRK